MELVPIAQDPMFGSYNNEGFIRTSFAMICAWAGERELALKQLEAVTKIPGGPGYGELRLRSDVGSVARRSALRKNRRLVSAERNGFQITPLVLGAEEWWNARRPQGVGNAATPPDFAVHARESGFLRPSAMPIVLRTKRSTLTSAND